MAKLGDVREWEKPYSTDVIGEATRHAIPVPEMTLDGERPHGLQQVVKAGAVYFLIAFGAGFVLEVIRLQVVALHVSERIAQAMEIPFHLLAMIIAARWAIDRFTLPPFPSIRLGVGLVALGLWLVMEWIVILAFHGLSLDEFLATQDPVVGTLPIGALGVLTVMPFLVGYRWER
ncbi:MAG: hypothetical protein KF693_04195 [Nitrospira sp.]|nr:hypothetical protein [Nitrospira sp.]